MGERGKNRKMAKSIRKCIFCRGIYHRFFSSPVFSLFLRIPQQTIKETRETRTSDVRLFGAKGKLPKAQHRFGDDPTEFSFWPVLVSQFTVTKTKQKPKKERAFTTLATSHCSFSSYEIRYRNSSAHVLC